MVRRTWSVDSEFAIALYLHHFAWLRFRMRKGAMYSTTAPSVHILRRVSHSSFPVHRRCHAAVANMRQYQTLSRESSSYNLFSNNKSVSLCFSSLWTFKWAMDKSSLFVHMVSINWTHLDQMCFSCTQCASMIIWHHICIACILLLIFYFYESFHLKFTFVKKLDRFVHG